MSEYSNPYDVAATRRRANIASKAYRGMDYTPKFDPNKSFLTKKTDEGTTRERKMAKSSIKGIKKQYEDIGAKIDDLSKTIGTFSSNLKQLDALTLYAVMHELMEKYVKNTTVDWEAQIGARNEFIDLAVNALNELYNGETFQDSYKVKVEYAK